MLENIGKIALAGKCFEPGRSFCFFRTQMTALLYFMEKTEAARVL